MFLFVLLFPGNTYTIYTRPDHDYGRLAVHSSHKYFAFRVRTCMDAHVGLMPFMEPQLAQYYEVVIGGYANTKSDIRKIGSDGSSTILASADTPSILSCDSFR